MLASCFFQILFGGRFSRLQRNVIFLCEGDHEDSLSAFRCCMCCVVCGDIHWENIFMGTILPVMTLRLARSAMLRLTEHVWSYIGEVFEEIPHIYRIFHIMLHFSADDPICKICWDKPNSFSVQNPQNNVGTLSITIKYSTLNIIMILWFSNHS